MAISREGRDVYKRFCLISMGIPAALLMLVLAFRFCPWAIQRSQVSSLTLNIAAVCLAAAGLGIWAFFNRVLYRRLWKIFPYIAQREKAWSYTEGVFGLLGVGSSMVSVLGVFFYLFTGDLSRSVVLIALAFILALYESARFPARLSEVERIISEME